MRFFSSAAFFAASAIPALHAEVVTLTPAQDTSIYEEAVDRANGAGDALFIGNTRDGHARRALLQFDVASVLPVGATIDAVTLTLHLEFSQTGSTPTIALHRLLASWGEAGSSGAGQGGPAQPGDATWSDRFFDTSNWTTAGGDFVAGAAAATAVPNNYPAFYTWSGSGLVSDVQGWLDGTHANAGWILVGNESSPQTAMRFDSRESATVAFRPELEISYTAAIPEPGTVALLTGLASLVVAGWIRRR